MTDLFAFAEARRARDAGMELASANSPRFGELAYAALERVARRQIHVHVDDVLAECSAIPTHPNAWGAVYMRAIREGLIQRTNQTRPSRHPAKHAHAYPVYFSLVYRGSL